MRLDGWHEITPGNFVKIKLGETPPASASAVAAGEEGTLHDDLEEELKRRRWLYVHSRMDRPTTTQKGVPDFIIFPPGGKVLLVECKTKTGKLSTDQNIFKTLAEVSGYQYEVVRSIQEFKGIKICH